MKLEYVLPHLRAGGKVKAIGHGFVLTLENLAAYFQTSKMLHLDFEIFKEPYKKEYKLIIKGSDYTINGDENLVLIDLLPRSGTYKITIEEITND
jgi:hypothetical protein